MANPWLARRVLCYAHQGGARENPSSTLYALRAAVAAGADALELDVHVTADGHLVVCHDPTLDRTSNGSGPIVDRTLDELRELDNAYWFVPGEDSVQGLAEDQYPLRGRAPADRALGIATLDEVLESFPDTFLNFDIKQTAPDIAPYEGLLAEALASAGRSDDVIVASFHDAATDAFRELAPAIGTSPGLAGVAAFVRAVRAGEALPQEVVSRHVALQVPARFVDTVVVDERLVEAAHEAGLAVHVWTINEPEEMEHLVALGVDGIISDFPSVLARVLDEQGCRYEL